MSDSKDLFKTKCPKCGANFLIRKEREGKKGRCPNCGEVFEVHPKKRRRQREVVAPSEPTTSAERLIMWFGILAVVAIVGYFGYSTWAKKHYEHRQARIASEVETLLARADDHIAKENYAEAKQLLNDARNKVAAIERDYGKLAEAVFSRLKLDKISDLVFFEGGWIPKAEYEKTLADRREAERMRKMREAESRFLESVAGVKTVLLGGAWLTREDGSSELLRGTPIVLCRRDVDTEKAAVGKLGADSGKGAPSVLEVARKRAEALADANESRSFVERLKQALGGSETATTETDIDGKYEFRDVPGGSYYLLAWLKGTVRHAWWLVPVKVDGSEPIQVNFTDANVMAMVGSGPAAVIPEPPSELEAPPETAPPAEIAVPESDIPPEPESEESLPEI